MSVIYGVSISVTSDVYNGVTAMYVYCTRSNVKAFLNVLCCFVTSLNVLEFGAIRYIRFMY